MASSRAADPSALARRPTESTLAWAHRLASSAEELHEHGKFGQAATHFEAASDAYISATLDTSDTHNMQSLRLLASAHANRAHELRLRMRLHGVRAAELQSWSSTTKAALFTTSFWPAHTSAAQSRALQPGPLPL